MLSAQIPSSTARRAPLALLTLSASLLPGLAFAETCPGDYDGLSCTNGTETICEDVGTEWRCDIDLPGGVSGGEIFAVRNEGGLCGSLTTWCVWGTDSTGDDFCCNLYRNNEDALTVYGTDWDDHIYFLYDSTYDLKNPFGTTLQGTAYGREGEDVIQGSRSTSSSYQDYLHGSEGNDSVFGNAGDDNIWGGGEDDYLYGGDDDDLIFGEGGHDYIAGGAGVDDITGTEGDDLISGGTGSDILDGGVGDDTVCGDNGDDTLYGDDYIEVDPAEGDDILWGGGGTDSADGDGDVYGDTCNAETTTNCESTPGSMSRPAACPGT